MSRADDFYGKGNPDAIFHGAPLAVAPWPRAGRRKDRKDFEESKVKHALEHPEQYATTKMDPRTLHSTQPHIVRAAVQHYTGSHSDTYESSNTPTRGNAGNARPVVYNRNGTRMILSGHNRAATSLLRGEQFDAVEIHGGYGDPR